jgi:hypothetical protein
MNDPVINKMIRKICSYPVITTVINNHKDIIINSKIIEFQCESELGMTPSKSFVIATTLYAIVQISEQNYLMASETIELLLDWHPFKVQDIMQSLVNEVIIKCVEAITIQFDRILTESELSYVKLHIYDFINTTNSEVLKQKFDMFKTQTNDFIKSAAFEQLRRKSTIKIFESCLHGFMGAFESIDDNVMRAAFNSYFVHTIMES